MLGYSQVRNEVFTLLKKIPQRINPKIEVDTKLLQLSEVTVRQRRQLEQLQGHFTALYLKWRYGSPDTYILLAFVEQVLVHIAWIVPARKIKGRYPFVLKGSYSIISCLTSECLRGKGIYSSQIQKIVQSDIPAKTFYIWTASTNIPSLKGIRKAGGIKVGEFVEKVLYLNSHREELLEMGQNARRVAVEQFDRDKLALEALDVISSIAT